MHANVILQWTFSDLFSPHEWVAAVLGMSARAARQLVQRRRTSGPTTPARLSTPAIDNFTIGAIRRHVHALFASKEYVTVESRLEKLIVDEVVIVATSETTMRRILQQMGFGTERHSARCTCGRSRWRSPAVASEPCGAWKRIERTVTRSCISMRRGLPPAWATARSASTPPSHPRAQRTAARRSSSPPVRSGQPPSNDPHSMKRRTGKLAMCASPQWSRWWSPPSMTMTTILCFPIQLMCVTCRKYRQAAFLFSPHAFQTKPLINDCAHLPKFLGSDYKLPTGKFSRVGTLQSSLFRRIPSQCSSSLAGSTGVHFFYTSFYAFRAAVRLHASSVVAF